MDFLNEHSFWFLNRLFIDCREYLLFEESVFSNLVYHPLNTRHLIQMKYACGKPPRSILSGSIYLLATFNGVNIAHGLSTQPTTRRYPSYILLAPCQGKKNFQTGNERDRDSLLRMGDMLTGISFFIWTWAWLYCCKNPLQGWPSVWT